MMNREWLNPRQTFYSIIWSGFKYAPHFHISPPPQKLNPRPRPYDDYPR